MKHQRSHTPPSNNSGSQPGQMLEKIPLFTNRFGLDVALERYVDGWWLVQSNAPLPDACVAISDALAARIKGLKP